MGWGPLKVAILSRWQSSRRPGKGGSRNNRSRRSRRTTLHLPLGKTARERIEAKFENFRREIEAWREKIDATDFHTE